MENKGGGIFVVVVVVVVAAIIVFYVEGDEIASRRFKGENKTQFLARI